MNFFLLDARVLLKRYALEPGTDLIDHLFRQVTLDRAMLRVALNTAQTHRAPATTWCN